ncbi:MAG: flagellar hook basal-body protein [Parvularculaceae bacterium]|nr:flagellar hook basal-body protein [Parvularculaceae bacterium]
MSFTSIFAIGVSSLTAFAKGIEAISGNVANTDTTGYKRVRTDFSSLLPTSSSGNGLVSAGAAGTGVAAAPRQLFSEQGAIARGNQATHVAVAGDGYFVVSRQPGANNPGDLLFTRAGDFKPDADGNLVNAAGFYLKGTTSASGGAQGLQTVNVNRLPTGADPAALGALVSVEIGQDGSVNATYADGTNFTISRIPLALFVNEDGLALADRTAVRATALSGEAVIAAARTGRAGAIEGSALEGSTVDIGAEFSALIETQRAYSTGARILSTADELWRTLVSTAA